MIDLHSHLLFGLDDGPESPIESYEIIKHLSSFGFTELVPTPHKFHMLFNPTAGEVIEKINSLKRSIIKRFTFEYMCKVDSILSLENHHEIGFTSKKEKIILIEFASSVTSKEEIFKKLFALNSAGIVPLIAHIERYRKSDDFWIECKRRYRTLFQGCIKTLAKPSYDGRKKQLVRLFDIDLIDNMATDIHKATQLSKVEKGLDFIIKKFGSQSQKFFVDTFPC